MYRWEWPDTLEFNVPRELNMSLVQIAGLGINLDDYDERTYHGDIDRAIRAIRADVDAAIAEIQAVVNEVSECEAVTA